MQKLHDTAESAKCSVFSRGAYIMSRMIDSCTSSLQCWY